MLLLAGKMSPKSITSLFHSILFYSNLRLLVRVRRLQRRMGSSSSMLDHEDSMSAVLDILTKSSPPSKKLLLF